MMMMKLEFEYQNKAVFLFSVAVNTDTGHYVPKCVAAFL